MTIENFFKPYGNEKIVFDPIPSYSGDWIFTIDNLLRNAKKENGVNLFQEFYKKTYQEPLENIFKTPRILDLQVGMISSPNDNNVGRCLRYSKVDFFVELTGFLNQHIDKYAKSLEEQQKYIMNLINNLKKDNETLNLAYADALKLKASKLKDLMDNEINSEYFEMAMQDYAPYKSSMDFSSYIKSAYKITTDFQNGMIRLGDFFDQNIDCHELYKSFDPDIFYLLFAKIIYEFNLIREKEDKVLDNSYSYLHYYDKGIQEVVREIKEKKKNNEQLAPEDKKYDPRIFFTTPGGKKLEYSRWEFQNQFRELMDRHPEAKAFALPQLQDENNEKYRNIELMEKLTKLYAEDTQVNWEFLPEGEGIKKGHKINGERIEKIPKKDKSELINEVNMRISILENSGFIGRPVKGLNTFAGYYAFIYPNGKVILEKFWENEETMNPAISAATYVMTIDNFVEMSKISRLNLIEYIKTLPEVGVKRIFHTTINNWQRNLNDEISGTYRLEDAIDFINSLKSGERTNE